MINPKYKIYGGGLLLYYNPRVVLLNSYEINNQNEQIRANVQYKKDKFELTFELVAFYLHFNPILLYTEEMESLCQSLERY